MDVLENQRKNIMITRANIWGQNVSLDLSQHCTAEKIDENGFVFFRSIWQERQ